MRTTSFILAFAFLLAGPTFTPRAESTLPGAGAFSYGDVPAAPLTTAGLTLAVRG